MDLLDLQEIVILERLDRSIYIFREHLDYIVVKINTFLVSLLPPHFQCTAELAGVSADSDKQNTITQAEPNIYPMENQIREKIDNKKEKTQLNFLSLKSLPQLVQYPGSSEIHLILYLLPVPQ